MKAVTFGEIMMRLNPEGYLRFVQANSFNGIPFVPQKFRNFPAILEHRKIQANPL